LLFSFIPSTAQRRRNTPPAKLPKRTRQIEYRLFLSEILKDFVKKNKIQNQKEYQTYYHIFRSLLEQIYVELDYTPLMQELQIPKEDFHRFILEGKMNVIVIHLYKINEKLIPVREKIRKFQNSPEDLKMYALLLKLDPKTLRELLALPLEEKIKKENPVR
jgi:hypothetical protein